MKKILIVLSVLLLFGCIDLNNNEYNLKLKTDKDIKKLLPGEDFNVNIVKISGEDTNNILLEFNNEKIKTSFNKSEKLEVKEEINILKVTVNNSYTRQVEIVPKKINTNKLLYIYMCGDNDMSNQAMIDIEEIKLGTEKNSDVSVIIFLDRFDGNIDNSYLLVKDGEIKVLKTLEEKNTGDKQTLTDFINYGKMCFNSKSNYLVLWNHGNGWYGDENLIKERNQQKRAIGFDINSNDWLNLYELENAVSTLGKKWDIVLFDACLMNTIEVVYQLKDSTKYIVGSPEEIPMSGFNYKILIDVISKNNDNNEIGKKIIQETIEEFNSKNNFAIYSLINTQYLDEIINKINNYSLDIIEKIKNCNSYIKDTNKNILSYSHLENDYLVTTEIADLHETFLLFDDIYPIKNITNSLNKVVEYKESTSNYFEMDLSKSCGLSIYFPHNELLKEYFYSSDFGENSNWSKLITYLF